MYSASRFKLFFSLRPKNSGGIKCAVFARKLRPQKAAGKFPVFVAVGKTLHNEPDAAVSRADYALCEAARNQKPVHVDRLRHGRVRPHAHRYELEFAENLFEVFWNAVLVVVPENNSAANAARRHHFLELARRKIFFAEPNIAHVQPELFRLPFCRRDVPCYCRVGLRHVAHAFCVDERDRLDVRARCPHRPTSRVKAARSACIRTCRRRRVFLPAVFRTHTPPPTARATRCLWSILQARQRLRGFFSFGACRYFFSEILNLILQQIINASNAICNGCIFLSLEKFDAARRRCNSLPRKCFAL